MKRLRKYEIITISTVFVMSLFVLNNIYAQDTGINQLNTDSGQSLSLTEIDSFKTRIDGLPDYSKDCLSLKLGDDYVQRVIDGDILYDDFNSVLKECLGDKTVALGYDDSVNSIQTISNTFNSFGDSAQTVEIQIKDTVKSGIDRNIIRIRQETNTPAYELQKAIDQDRLELYQQIDSTLKNIKISTDSSIDEFANFVESKVESIAQSLRDQSGSSVDFEEEKRSIRNLLNEFSEEISIKKALISDRGGDLIFVDTDGDGLSDYDERFIFGTDPDKAKTIDGELTDAQKIEQGIDPLSESLERIQYEDPREDKKSFVSSNYKLESVALVKDGDKESVLFVGKAIPNSYVTIFIYSTPIIVTVKTDDNGDWTYELEKELENGEHQLYVATVNNSGKIIARSNPILFTKTAEAASIGIFGVNVETSRAGDFFRDNFILIALAILIASVILSLMFIGNRKNIKEVVGDLKNEVSDSPKKEVVKKEQNNN